MQLIPSFVKLGVVAGRSRTRAGSLPAVSPDGRAVPRPSEERHGQSIGAAWTWHGICESDTAALCTSNEKDTL
jgi:hypothetical protein